MKNSQYTVVMKNAFHGDLLVNLGRKMFPRTSGFLSEVYNRVTGDNDHGYFVIDNSVLCDKKHSIKTGIFPNEQRRLFVPVGY